MYELELTDGEDDDEEDEGEDTRDVEASPDLGAETGLASTDTSRASSAGGSFLGGVPGGGVSRGRAGGLAVRSWPESEEKNHAIDIQSELKSKHPK